MLRCWLFGHNHKLIATDQSCSWRNEDGSLTPIQLSFLKCSNCGLRDTIHLDKDSKHTYANKMIAEWEKAGVLPNEEKEDTTPTTETEGNIIHLKFPPKK